jgi:hypothetical protein
MLIRSGASFLLLLRAARIEMHDFVNAPKTPSL